MQKLKILIVDDEKALRTIFKRVLEKSGHEILTAGNGLEAIRLLAIHNDINLTITDLDMGEMDGLDLLVYMKNTEHNSRRWLASGAMTPEVSNIALNELGAEVACVKINLLKKFKEKGIIE